MDKEKDVLLFIIRGKARAKEIIVGLVVRRGHEAWSDAKETKGPEYT